MFEIPLAWWPSLPRRYVALMGAVGLTLMRGSSSGIPDIWGEWPTSGARDPFSLGSKANINRLKISYTKLLCCLSILNPIQIYTVLELEGLGSHPPMCFYSRERGDPETSQSCPGERKTLFSAHGPLSTMRSSCVSWLLFTDYSELQNTLCNYCINHFFFNESALGLVKTTVPDLFTWKVTPCRWRSYCLTAEQTKTISPK